jgi:hypothetical protein
MELTLLAQNLLAIPLCVITIISAIKTWPALWDDQLTTSEKRLLLRIALVVLLPIVVLLHECGHAAATLLFGGEVAEFHYGFLWGEVVSRGNFSDWQNLWITLAGNIVQIDCGLVALLIAFFSKSPPLVALCVYVAFFSIAGTLVFYAGLSLISIYGDWIAIYTSPLKSAISVIAFLHLLSVALIVWSLISPKTSLWFARKTNPYMVDEERRLLESLDHEPRPSAKSLLKIGWFYFQHDLPRMAETYVFKVNRIEHDNPENQLLEGWIRFAAADWRKASERFLQCTKNKSATTLQKLRGYLGAAFCRTQEVERTLRGAEGSYEQWSGAIDFYTCAIELQPKLGDPKFYRADLFCRAHLYNRAIKDLSDAINEEFLDQGLATKAATKLEALMAIEAQPQ